MLRCPHCNHLQEIRNSFLPCLKLIRFYFEGKSFTSSLLREVKGTDLQAHNVMHSRRVVSL